MQQSLRLLALLVIGCLASFAGTVTYTLGTPDGNYDEITGETPFTFKWTFTPPAGMTPTLAKIVVAHEDLGTCCGDNVFALNGHEIAIIPDTGDLLGVASPIVIENIPASYLNWDGSETLTITDSESGDFAKFDYLSLTVSDEAVIPEPSTMLLGGLGIAVLGLLRRR